MAWIRCCATMEFPTIYFLHSCNHCTVCMPIHMCFAISWKKGNKHPGNSSPVIFQDHCEHYVSVCVFSITLSSEWHSLENSVDVRWYGSITHIPMIIVGVASVLLTLPYIALLFCVQCVRRINHQFFNWISSLKPLTDAYTGIHKISMCILDWAFTTGQICSICGCYFWYCSK